MNKLELKMTKTETEILIKSLEKWMDDNNKLTPKYLKISHYLQDVLESSEEENKS